MTQKQIILHIGAPKCGSTFLQRVMLGNRDRLKQAGVYYPHADDGRDHAGNAGHLNKLFETGQIAHYLEQDADTVFLSHEDLFERPRWAIDMTEWARSQGIGMTIIAFLRPYSELIFGIYSQFMKQHFETYLARREAYEGMDFEEFCKSRFKKINYALAIRQWNDLARPGTLQLHHYRQIRPVIESHIGVIEGMNWELDRKLSNVSLRVSDCERIAEAIQDTSQSKEHIIGLFRQAYEDTRLPDTKGRTPERVAWIENLHSERTKTIHQNFGFDNSVG